MTGDASLDHLQRRLLLIEARVAAAVARRRASDPDPDDRFRGLYLTEEHVDALLQPTSEEEDIATEGVVVDELAQRVTAVEDEAADAESNGADLRLRRLASAFGLDAVDLDLLLVALAPDVDPRFEQLYGYLHDDLTRRRASVGLALELAGCGVIGRWRLDPPGPLVAGHLLLVEDDDRPYLTRSLRVPDRVAWHLLGSDASDPVLAPVLDPLAIAGMTPPAAAAMLTRALQSGVRLILVRERIGSAASALAVDGLAGAGLQAVVLDLHRVEPGVDLASLFASAVREARLRGAGVVAGPAERLAELEATAVRTLTAAPVVVVLTGNGGWDRAWADDVPFLIDAPVVPPDDRVRLWRQALGIGGKKNGVVAGAAAHFRLGPGQILSAARAARRQAAVAERPLTPADVCGNARAQNAGGLERLARRLEPQVGWSDLVLPEEVLFQLRHLAARVRHRDRVFGEWRMAPPVAGGRGITALLTGESGTGKTLSAAVVAAELGLDLYVIDMATVIDKYIGETEKNLDRIFAEADRVNGVLLFDEADALFGKRSEVRDAHDRYANVEVAYLLQRMESFDGLALLTTNLRANLDEAFTRRLDAVIDFPLPEEEDRRRLWALHLRSSVPQCGDLDLDFVARAFKLSGGNIANAALTAAYLAAQADKPMGMDDLIRSIAIEYRKLGRLCLESEFGPWFSLVASGRKAVGTGGF